MHKKKAEVLSKLILKKLKDKYEQYFHNTISLNSKLTKYSNIKKNYKYESFLSNILNVNFRKSVTRFRICAHQLPIEYGRYKNIPRDQRLCNLNFNCTAVGDEKHYVTFCQNAQIKNARLSCNQAIEKKIPNFSKLDKNSKFIYIMLCSDISIQNEIAKFLNTIEQTVKV